MKLYFLTAFSISFSIQIHAQISPKALRDALFLDFQNVKEYLEKERACEYAAIVQNMHGYGEYEYWLQGSVN